jgi:hypothetical protein
MDDCSFEKLVQLLERRLSLNAQLKVFSHLDGCEICRDTMYHIARDRDEAAGVLSVRGKKSGLKRAPAREPGLGIVQGSGNAPQTFARTQVTGTHG